MCLSSLAEVPSPCSSGSLWISLLTKSHTLIGCIVLIAKATHRVHSADVPPCRVNRILSSGRIPIQPVSETGWICRFLLPHFHSNKGSPQIPLVGGIVRPSASPVRCAILRKSLIEGYIAREVLSDPVAQEASPGNFPVCSVLHQRT